MKKIILLSMMLSVSLFAVSAGQLEVNKAVAIKYCKNLSGIGSMSYGVSYTKYYNTCASLYKYPFDKHPTTQQIAKALKK